MAIDKDLFQGLVAPIFPEHATREIEERDLSGPMLNRFEWGGYLIWRWFLERQVFLSECMPLAYNEQIYPDYLRLLKGIDVPILLERYGFQYAIFPDLAPHFIRP